MCDDLQFHPNNDLTTEQKEKWLCIVAEMRKVYSSLALLENSTDHVDKLFSCIKNITANGIDFSYMCIELGSVIALLNTYYPLSYD